MSDSTELTEMENQLRFVLLQTFNYQSSVLQLQLFLIKVGLDETYSVVDLNVRLIVED